MSQRKDAQGRTSRLTRRPLAATLAVLTAATGCAGATLGSGVGDRLLERPPYLAGSAAPAPARVAHLPARYQRGASHEAMFDPVQEPGSPITSFLGELNQALGELVLSLPPGPVARMPGGEPDVIFGCETDPLDECQLGEVGKPRYRLAVTRASRAWTGWAQDAMGDSHTGALLVVTVEVGQYLVRQRDLLGRKIVDLGTGYSPSLPWLTSLETPVSVVQLTGAMVDSSGRVMRIAAEGMLARRTSLAESSFGLQALMTDAEVDELRAARRDDLPGRPLVWQVALRNLVKAMLGA